jgi:hypothetical protein
MAIRKTTHILKNTQTNNKALPSGGVQMGEPLVNLFNGIVFFSGVTGGNFTKSDNNNTYFEVGSNLYDLKIRNQITSYSGITNLTGKYLKGTSTGFVLDDITNIGSVTNFDFVPSTDVLTIYQSNGNNLSVVLSAFTNVNLYGTTNVNGNLTITGTGIYNTTATGTNPLEIVNYSSLTAFSQTKDVYVTGNTLISANDNTSTQSAQLEYHGTPVGGPYFITTQNTFVTGGTYNNGTITFVKNDSTNFQVTGIDSTDTYVTGGTNNASTNFTNSASIGLKYNRDVVDGIYSLPYTNTYVTGGTYSSGTVTLTRNDGVTIDVTGLSSTDTFVTGFTYNSTNNSLTISQNQGRPDLTQFINSVSGLTVSNLTAGQVVYVGSDGKLKTEGDFLYNDSTNTLTVGGTSGKLVVNNGISDGASTFGQGGVIIGSGGSYNTPGVGDLTIHGNLTIFGSATTVSTNELYVEDPQITLNYNPSGSTYVTSIASGFRVQDGSGVSGSTQDVYLTIAQMNTLTGLTGTQVPVITEYTSAIGYSNRGWLTQLNDIVIRNTNLNNGAPNGVRVLAEFDTLDGGQY